MKKTTLPKPITTAEAYKECPTNIFKFKTTKELDKSHQIIAQDRAVKAINMGLGIRKPGYNIYVSGYQGTGKTTVIRKFLEKCCKYDVTLYDWVYVNDFDKSKTAKALHLPKGQAKKLKKRVDAFIRDLRNEIPLSFQSAEYENSVNTYVSSANERKSKLYSELEKMAKSLDFTLKSTRIGIETIPIKEGRTLTEKEYSKLNDAERDEIEKRRAKLEPEVLDFARKVRSIENETREYIEELRTDIGNKLIDSLISPIIEEYEDLKCDDVVKHFKQIKEHIIENILEFIEIEESSGEEEGYLVEPKDKFKLYTINVFIDNSNTKDSPVVIESNPTYYNLFGKVEKNVEQGVYQTDFSMIKPGAIHKANGGYLVINAMDIFRTPVIWETLKRVLRNKEAFIEDMGEQYSMLPTSGLKVEPIPLDIKVIMIGNEEIYHILFEGDDEFNKIFKIKADFDYKMDRNKKNINSYSAFIATRAAVENLLPFDKSAVATIVEYSSKSVEDQRLLSTQFGEIKDLTIESDYVAREMGAKTIKRIHVEEALDRKFYRLNLFEQHLLEMIENGDILLDVEGKRIGQVNGLTVYDMGDYSFGKIGRITCTTSISDDGIINIERASRLSGSTHDKGVYIISGYLNAVLAKKRSLGLSASICFEQSYGYIDGDSASTAELIGIVSAMANIPVKQNFAITGSVNQLGDIQAVGGINEKIEGFYKICKLIGKGKKYNIIIPFQNVANLMLHRDVREAISKGILNIYPVKYLWEAFELATDIPLGVKNIQSKIFTPNSAFDIINKKIDALIEEEEKANKSFKKVEKSNKKSLTKKKAAKSRKTK